MSYEKTTTCHTAEELFATLQDIPQGFREKMGLIFCPDADVPEGQVTVSAFFLTSHETDTGYESGLIISGSL